LIKLSGALGATQVQSSRKQRKENKGKKEKERIKMPEIAEIYRIVHFLRKHALGRVITQASAADDTIVFKDTTGAEFMQKLKGRTVTGVGRQGKYFW
jgi:hypothetical protein